MQDQGAISYKKYLDGDDQGMVELIRDYKDGLILYLYSFTSNMTDAEELAIDTFVRLGVKRPKNKGTAGFKTWLYTIGRNIAINYLRKKQRRREVPLEELSLTDEEAHLERGYIRQEDRIALHRAMQKLPVQYRQVLWLVYFEDFSTKQAASALGKTVHSTEMQLSRARAALKKIMEKEGFSYAQL